jgi:hypothetical protein
MALKNRQMWLLEKIHGNEIWNDEFIFKHLYKGALNNFFALAYQGKNIMFRFIIEYNKFKDFGPYIYIINSLSPFCLWHSVLLQKRFVVELLLPRDPTQTIYNTQIPTHQTFDFYSFRKHTPPPPPSPPSPTPNNW